MRCVLIAGLWLDAAAWDPVIPELRAAGHVPVAVSLPGQGDGNLRATLDDQVAAVLATIDASDEPCVVVGHSAACTLAWIAGDRRPEAISALGMVGGFPANDGKPYAPWFEASDGVVPFPGWAAFEGPDSADLDPASRDHIEHDAIPVPGGVTQGIVSLTDERRYDLPVTLICPEFSPADAQQWISEGEVPSLVRATDLRYADIDSGHWPMFTRPAELAWIIGEL